MTSHAWRPSASIQTLKERARIIHDIRDFFCTRGYLEVETPLLGQYPVTDVYLENIEAHCLGKTYFLQTSPEYHMKRLLAAGSGSIFQIGKAFRNDEQGRWHNPEFTMLEWYQLDADHHALMREMDALLQNILHTPAMVKLSYRQAFKDACGLDVFEVSDLELHQYVHEKGWLNDQPQSTQDPDTCLFYLMVHEVEPVLAQYETPVALYDFPPSQAALSQIKNGVAQRFEVYYKGVELANGFHELIDADIQKKRFEKDNTQRAIKGLAQKPTDDRFLAAMASGLPPCSGVAMGIDRLIALSLNQSSLACAMSFPIDRA